MALLILDNSQQLLELRQALQLLVQQLLETLRLLLPIRLVLLELEQLHSPQHQVQEEKLELVLLQLL
jgi:hypothetical protein